MKFTFKMQFLIRLFFTVFFFECIGGCPGASPKLGYMTNDSIVQNGTSHRLTCSLFSTAVQLNRITSSVNSSHLIMRRGREVLETEVLDELSIQYWLKNVTVDDAGYYGCYVKVPKINYPQFVCLSRLTVGYFPMDVDNFSCVSLYYKSLICQWKIPENPVQTNYTLAVFDKVGKIVCPNNTKTSNSCTWTMSTTPPYNRQWKQLYFTLLGENMFGQINTKFSFSHSSIVLPGPPSLNIFVGKSSVTLELGPPYEIENSIMRLNLHYQLCYTALSKDRIKCDEYEKYQCQIFNSEKNFTKDNLLPYTSHLFCLRCKPKDANEEMWSNFTEKIINIQADVPYFAPNVTPAGISGKKKEGKQDHGKRNVTIYWQSVPEEFYNGPNFCYHITYNNCLDDKNVIGSECEKKSYLQIMDLAVDACYLFKICPSNDLGVSQSCAYIKVPKNYDYLPDVENIKISQNSAKSYNISWELSDYENGVPVENYTFFWCAFDSSKPLPLDCKSLQWIYTVNTHYEFIVPDTGIYYQFAVAANSGNLTSGIKWSSCALPVNGSQDFKGINIKIKKRSLTSLIVQWKLIGCAANFEEIIKEYRVSYCQFSENMCSGEQIFKNISNPLLEEYKLEGLHPNTRYRINLTAFASDGWSVGSDLIYVITDAESSLIVGTSVGIAFACIFVVLILYCGVQRLKRKIDMERKIPVTLPDGLEAADENTYECFKQEVDRIREKNGVSQPMTLDKSFMSSKNQPRTRHKSERAEEWNTSHDKLLFYDEGLSDSKDGQKVSPIPNQLTSVSSLVEQKQESLDSGTEDEKNELLQCTLCEKFFCKEHSFDFNLSDIESTDKSCSKDSGLGKENSLVIEKMIHFPSVWSCSNSNLATDNFETFQPYSKFNINSKTHYIACGGKPLESQNYSLASSEPSIADIAIKNYFPQTCHNFFPYSKYGLSKSDSDTLYVARRMTPEKLSHPEFDVADGITDFNFQKISQDVISQNNIDSCVAKNPYVSFSFAARPHEKADKAGSVNIIRSNQITRNFAPDENDANELKSPSSSELSKGTLSGTYYSKFSLQPNKLDKTELGYVRIKGANEDDKMCDASFTTGTRKNSVDSSQYVEQPVNILPNTNGYCSLPSFNVDLKAKPLPKLSPQMDTKYFSLGILSPVKTTDETTNNVSNAFSELFPFCEHAGKEKRPIQSKENHDKAA